MGNATPLKIRKPATLLLLTVAAVASAGATDLGRAQEHYWRTDYTSALDILLPLPDKDATIDALIGKAYYMDGHYKNAAAYLEKAIGQDPGNSSYYDWLGKAYGRRAETSSFLTALPWANKTRAAFEKAVALDGSNLEALSDLFEYYLEAPGLVGGGVDKAERIAAQIQRFSGAEYHYACARLAEKRKDFARAEQELRMAMELAPNQIGRVIDLAEFLSKHGRFEESDALFRRAAEMQPRSPKLMFARAESYIHSGRNLPQAQQLLHEYASLQITPDDPSRAEAARLLKNLH